MRSLALAMSTVLFVSGANSVGQSTCQHLAVKGYDVVLAASATEALRSLHTLTVDAVIFDTAVSDMSAHDFCHSFRQAPRCEDVPTLFLAPAAFRWLPDSVPMRIGRDTLVGKPFLCSEVEQTLKQLLGPSTTPILKTLTVGDLSLDRGLFALSCEGDSVTLTPTEFRLLEYLMERPGTVVAAEELLEKVWGFFPHSGSGDIVRSHMRNLRRKISRVTRGREVIRTLPRRGYRLTA
ncbi:MAG: response regulator transcription factor [Dehalococcoidia bacterium]|nr:MAG: response regulator transcription factor [Dehalococcoidia bacterium]